MKDEPKKDKRSRTSESAAVLGANVFTVVESKLADSGQAGDGLYVMRLREHIKRGD
jgi:hypothetical protein